MKNLVLKPRVSEKSYSQSQTTNTYVIDVPVSTNKQIVSSAVEAQFGVSVLVVNTVIVKGKTKRFVTAGRSKFGKRKDIKKAYVTLKAGDSLPVFASEEKPTAKKDKKK